MCPSKGYVSGYLRRPLRSYEEVSREEKRSPRPTARAAGLSKHKQLSKPCDILKKDGSSHDEAGEQ